MNDNEVFEAQHNQYGRNIENDFINFLTNFELDLNDPNYAQYADGLVDLQEGQQIHYYRIKANEMREQEKNTMYIDFAHLSQFNHQDPEFMKNVVHNFNKFEPNLRAGLTKFMQ